MILTALLLTALAALTCLVALRALLGALGLDLMQVLVWFGLAETPAPPASRRGRLRALQ